jgi:hypothetical protein
MQHLNSETLARLVEESPDPQETRHLNGCAACRAELDALRAQTATLRELPCLSPPPVEWAELQARLAEGGLIRSGATAVQPALPDRPSRAGRWSGALLRLAAALAIFVAGGVAGAAAAGGKLPGAAPVAVRAPENPRSVEEAAGSLRDAEAAYLAALTRYSELAGTPQPADAATRLAALEGIVLTTRAALNEAPADPVINGYHLTAVGQRDAMLRQISNNSQDPWF